MSYTSHISHTSYPIKQQNCRRICWAGHSPALQETYPGQCSLKQAVSFSSPRAFTTCASRPRRFSSWR